MDKKKTLQTKIALQSQSLPNGVGIWHSAVSNISLNDLFSRTPFSGLILENLRNSRVVIFGGGSGGGEIAVRLAQAGVGNICLSDPKLLEVHNCARHVGSLLDVGRSKVEVIAEQVLLHNPQVVVETYDLDLFHPDSPVAAEEVLQGADLIIAATDKTDVQLAVNTLTWRLGIPTLFGGCYEGARGGEVLFTLPGEGTPCLSCLRGGLAQPEHQGPFDYSAAEHPEDFQGEPGLSAAISQITNVEVQIALGILLRGTNSPLGSLIYPQYNYLLIGSALAAGFYRFRRPFHIFWQPLSGPRPGCDVCGAIAGEDDGGLSLLAAVKVGAAEAGLYEDGGESDE